MCVVTTLSKVYQVAEKMFGKLTCGLEYLFVFGYVSGQSLYRHFIGHLLWIMEVELCEQGRESFKC